MAGLLAWNLFNEIISRCLNLFIQQANLMKKLSFPRITMPTITVGTCLLDNLLLFAAILGIVGLLGHKISLAVLWVLPLTLIVVALAIGIGLILGILNVFLRDIGQVVPIVLQVWFWFTPIVYPQSIIPESYRHWLNLNPMYPLVNAYQNLFVYGVAPQLETLIPVVVTAMVLMLSGLFLFRRASAELVDVL
jgi:lipopolysaccharide transport system permease protein